MNKILHPIRNKEGVTLVEVLVAVLIVALVSSGIYTLGISMLRLAQTNRIMTQAQAYAKSGLEEIVSLDYDAFRSSDIPAQTNYVDVSTHKVTIIRTTDVIWHTRDGSVTNSSTSDGYAEVHIQSQFNVPGSSKTANTTFSTVIIHEGFDS